MNIYISYNGFVGIFLALFSVSIVYIHIVTTGRFRAIDFSMLSMGLLYGLGMPAVAQGAHYIYFPGSEFVLKYKDYMFIHTISSVISIAGIFIGWVCISDNKLRLLSSTLCDITISSIVKFSFYTLLISIISQYLYTKDYGGFIGYFNYNRLIRSSLLPEYERSAFSFLKPFGGFALIACFGFWGLILSRLGSRVIWTGFILSLVCSVYVLIASAGRLYMMSFFAILLIAWLLKRKVSYYVWFFGFFLMITVGFIGIFTLSNILNLKGGNNIYIYIIREISFPFTSFFAQLSEGNLFHLFHDVFLSPAYLLPSSITDKWLSNASEFNTVIMMGSKKGEFGVTGGIPTDIITFGLMQFGYAGILIYSVLFGCSMRVLSAIAGSFRFSGMRCISTAYVNINIAIIAVFYSFPKIIIVSNFSAIATVLFIWFVRIFSSRRRSSASV